MRQRLLAGVSNGQRDVLSTQPLRKNRSLPVKLNRGPLAFRAHYFDISPPDAMVPSCAQRLHTRFLGSKAGSIAFEATGFPLAVLNLALSEDAMQKPLPKALYRFTDARNLRDIHSGADNHGNHCQLLGCNWQLETNGTSEKLVATIDDLVPNEPSLGR